MVSEFCFKSLETVYYGLCFIGLMWQVSQISVNYFKFDVLTDIKVILPEEVIDNNALNVCFRYLEVMKFDTFLQMLSKYGIRERTDLVMAKERLDRNIIIGDIYKLTHDADQIFEFEGRTLNVSMFITLRLVCYRINNMKELKYVNLIPDKLDNVTMALLYYGNSKYRIDRERLRLETELRKTNVSTLALIRFNSYSVSRLKSPYQDDCVNYTNLGFVSKNDAINRCTNTKKIEKYNALYRYITIYNDSEFVRYPFSGQVNVFDEDKLECKKMYENDDCFKETIFTTVLIKTDIDNSSIGINIDKNTLPSYVTQSKPKIKHVDYITFIFGALGSWLGVSFLNINPIPRLFSRKNKKPLFETFQNDVSSRRFQNKLLLMEKKSELFYMKLYQIENTLTRVFN